MKYLLDTNVVSELAKSTPNPEVVDWVRKLPPRAVYLSVITIVEIKKGSEKTGDLQRKAVIEKWLKEDLLVRFDGRILPLGVEEMLEWGALVATAEKSGRTLPAVDSLLAAVTRYHGCVLVTRNEKDFEGIGISVINPWTIAASG